MHPDGFMMNQAGGTAFQELGDIKADYRFTSQRLRGNEIDSAPHKVLAIGDSFTFGLLLNEEDTYITHLNDALLNFGNDSVVVLNGGIGGAGLGDWPGWLETFGKKIKPDVVLYFLHTSDLDRALSKNLYVLKQDTLIKTQRWQPRAFMFVLGQKNWYRSLQAHSHLFNIIVKILWKKAYFKDLTHSFNHSNTHVPIPNQEDFFLESDYSVHLGQKLLEQMDKWCVENECQLIITTTGFFQGDAESNHTSKLYSHILENPAFLPGSVLFYDNSPCLDSLTAGNLDGIRIPGDSHPNEQGAQLIADCTWSWFKEYLKK